MGFARALTSLVLLLALFGEASAAQAAKKKVVKCPKSCDPAKGTCEGQFLSDPNSSRGSFATMALGSATTKDMRKTQKLSYCEMSNWLGLSDDVVKAMEAIDKYFAASEKFNSSASYLNVQMDPYLKKPPCAKVSGETNENCVPVSKSLVEQITAGRPVTATIDLALFVADFVCGKELEDGQKKMIPSFDDLENNGAFVREVLGLGPVINKAKDVADDGAGLRAPIPVTVTNVFKFVRVGLDNFDILAGIAMEYIRTSTGICKPDPEDPNAKAPVDYVREPPIKCFRAFLDRAVKYVTVINMELQSINGFLMTFENDFIDAALNGRGLSAEDLPKSMPSKRDAACRSGFGANAGRRLQSQQPPRLQLRSSFKPMPANWSNYEAHVKRNAELAANLNSSVRLFNSSNAYGRKLQANERQLQGALCIAWPDFPDLNLKIPKVKLVMPAIDPFRFPGLPGPINLPSLPNLPSLNLTLPPWPWVNATLPNPFANLTITIPHLGPINFTFPKVEITVPDLQLELAGYAFSLAGYKFPIPGFDITIPRLPGFDLQLPDLPGFDMPYPFPGFPDFPDIPIPDIGFNIRIPRITGLKLRLPKLPNIKVPVPKLPDFNLDIPKPTPLRFPGWDVKLPGFNYTFPDFDINLTPPWNIKIPGLSGFDIELPNLPQIDFNFPDIGPIDINLTAIFGDIDFPDLPGLPSPMPTLRLSDLLMGINPPIGLPELFGEFPGLPDMPSITGFNISLADLLPNIDIDLAALLKNIYRELNIQLDIPDLPKVNLKLLFKGFNFNLGDLLPRLGFTVPDIILVGIQPYPSLSSLLPNININITQIWGGFNITLPSVPQVDISLDKLLAGLQPPPSLPDIFGDIEVDLSKLLKNLNLPNLPPLPTIKLSLPDFLALIPGISPPLNLRNLLPKINIRLPALPSIKIDSAGFFKKWSISFKSLLELFILPSMSPLPTLSLPDLFLGITPPIGMPDLIPEFPNLPDLPDIPGLNINFPDLLPNIDVDLEAFYRALYAKLNITVDVPDLPTVNLKELFQGIRFNLGDLLPDFNIDLPKLILAGMSPMPSLRDFLPNLSVNINLIFGRFRITLPSIPSVNINLSALFTALSPAPNLLDLFGKFEVDMTLLLKLLDIPDLPPLPNLKIRLPDLLPLIPGISPPLNLSNLLPKITIRLPSLPSFDLDLWSFLRKFQVDLSDLLKLFKINIPLPKIRFPDIKLPDLFLGIQPPIRLSDFLPALDIDWPDLPSIPGFRIPLSLILPDIEIDLVAFLKKLDPRIQFPLDFPTPYRIRLPDLFAGINIDLPSLPKFNVTVPKLFLSAWGLKGWGLPQFLPDINISILDILRGLDISLPDLPPLPDISLEDLLSGIQPPLRLPDILGDFKINFGDLLPRLNIPNLPPMPTPFIDISLGDLLPKLDLDIDLDLDFGDLPDIPLPKLPRISFDLLKLLDKLNIGLKKLFALFKMSLGDLFNWFDLDLGDFFNFPDIKIPLPSLPVLPSMTPFFPPIDLKLPSFDFELPEFDIDIPWFSIKLPNLPDISVDISKPIEVAAEIIDTAAGIIKESTKLLPFIDSLMEEIGWDKLKALCNELFAIIDLIRDKFVPLMEQMISLLADVVDAISKLECPSWISWVCVIADLIQDAIRDIIDKVAEALDFKGWVKKILEAIPVDEILGFFGSIASMIAKYNPIAILMEMIEAKINEMIDDFLDMFMPYIDFGQFNPLSGLFCEGDDTSKGTPWVLRPEIGKKSATRVGGQAMTFMCPVDYYPVIDTAERRIWKCTQQLSALMRFPCPDKSINTCTVDYDDKYGDTLCKQTEYSGLPKGEELQAFRDMYGVDRLDGEDVFKTTYLCVPKDLPFNVLSEILEFRLFTQLKGGETRTWDNTGQNKYVLDSKLRLPDGTAQTKIDCSGGGRRTHVEYYTPPTANGRYAWHPCYSPWYNQTAATRSGAALDRLDELCWYIKAEDEGKLLDEEDFGTNDDTCPFGSGNGNIYKGTQLGYSCMGDASPVYWTHLWGFDTTGNGYDDRNPRNFFKYYPTYELCKQKMQPIGKSGTYESGDCDDANWCYENNGRYYKNANDEYVSWPKNEGDWAGYVFDYPEELAENKARGGSSYKHPFHEFELYKPADWCADNFPTPSAGYTKATKYSYNAQGATDTCSECTPKDDTDCNIVDAVEYWERNDQYELQTRRDARADRLALWNDLRSKHPPNKPNNAAQQAMSAECKAAIESCEGKPTCDVAACLPETLQVACMEPLYFSTEAAFANTTRLVYIFGSSLATLKRGAACPDGQLFRVKFAEYGANIRSESVAEKAAFQAQCPVGSQSCNFDITKLGADYQPKALRIEYTCECPSGFDPLPATDPSNPSGAGACVRCKPGYYRGDFDPACMACPAGTYSDVSHKGEECVQCPAGTFAPTEASSSCQACKPGFYGPVGAVTCRPCIGNTYQPAMGQGQCDPCPPGFFNGNDVFAAITCDQCPAGSYRTANMAKCEPCPLGKYGNATGMATCTDCPPGYFAPSVNSTQCMFCPIGTYQDKAGQPGCKLCPDGFYTPGNAATTAANCTIQDKPLDYDAMAVQIALKYMNGNKRRRLLQDGTVPATLSELSDAKAATSKFNATICAELLLALGVKNGLAERANGICNGGPFNTAVCGWDGGDCCEATCKPNADMELSCSAANFQCRDPVVLARMARGAFSSTLNCTLPGSEMKTQLPANPPSTCPASANRGNGICDDELNIPACNWDNGDCCPATCRKSYIAGSCLPAQMNCRDQADNVDKADKVPPELINLPMPEDEIFKLPFSTLQKIAGVEPFSAVSARDNYPCFDGTVTISDKTIALTTKTPEQCQDNVLWRMERTWSAVDDAGNRASAKRMYEITDDQDAILVGDLVVPVPDPTVSQTPIRQTLTLGSVIPSKIYTWTIAPRAGTTGSRLTKTGGSASVTIGNTAGTGVEIVAPKTDSSVFTISITTRLPGCSNTVTQEVGTLTVTLQGLPRAIINPATASMRLSSPAVRFSAANSINPDTGSSSGLRYSWVVRTSAGAVVRSWTESSTLNALSIDRTVLGSTVKPPATFNVGLTVKNTKGQTSTANATLTVTAL